MQASHCGNVLPWKWHIAMPNKKVGIEERPHRFFEEESVLLDSIMCTTVWWIICEHSCRCSLVHWWKQSYSFWLWTWSSGYVWSLPQVHPARKQEEEENWLYKVEGNGVACPFIVFVPSDRKFVHEEAAVESSLWGNFAPCWQSEETCLVQYLNHQNEAVSTNHAKQQCVRTDVDCFRVLNATYSPKPTLAARYRSLYDALDHSAEYEPILLEDHSPADARRHLDYNHDLVVPTKCVLYTYSGSRNHLHFLWRISCDLNKTELLQKNMKLQQELWKDLPSFHTYAMRREFIHTFGVATHSKPAFLWEACRHLTGASNTIEELEVDKRVAVYCWTQKIQI